MRVLVVLTACIALAGPGAVRAADDTRTCRAVEMTAANVRVDEGHGWAPLVAGQPIPADARLLTGPESRLRIRCSDGIEVTVGVGTEVLLGGLVGPSGAKQSIAVRLFSGIAGFVAPKRTFDQFEVKTDLAIASVRSTEWLVEADPKSGTSVFTRVGIVEVEAFGPPSTNGQPSIVPVGEVAADQGTTVAPDGTPGPIKRWGAARIAAAGAALGPGWQ